uniref:Uncharacterized protein n=1 Tax=Myotis myotis TaxID=51298 RepID=A0A7J7UPY5_MYOMY|nr:hypothetical protein mMyoMyo1_008629 [Myotis myotis]
MLLHMKVLHIKWHDHSHLYNRSKSSQSQHKVSLSQKMCLTSHSTQGLCLLVLVYIFKIKGIFRVLSYHPNSTYSIQVKVSLTKSSPSLVPSRPQGSLCSLTYLVLTVPTELGLLESSLRNRNYTELKCPTFDRVE